MGLYQKKHASVVERQKKKFCYPSLSFGKEDTLIIFCQLEIDHVTQQPKETCQRTCRGPRSVNIEIKIPSSPILQKTNNFFTFFCPSLKKWLNQNKIKALSFFIIIFTINSHG